MITSVFTQSGSAMTRSVTGTSDAGAAKSVVEADKKDPSVNAKIEKASSNPINYSVTVSLSATLKATQINDGNKKDFATVAKDARASIDAGYQKSGKTGDIYSTDAEWKTAFNGLDRRSLYAVASNEGGQFSEAEQMSAQYFMNKQVEQAIGLDHPANAMNPTAAMQKAGIQFLDSVSDEEKTSITWARQRAAVQGAYEVLSRQEGKEPDDVDSDSPLVKLIRGGLENLRRGGNPANQLEDTPEYKQAVQLAEQMKAARAQAAGIKDKDGGA